MGVESTSLLGVLKAKIHYLDKVSFAKRLNCFGRHLLVGLHGLVRGSLKSSRRFLTYLLFPAPYLPPPSHYFTPTYGSRQETVSYLDILCTYEEKDGKGQVYKAPQQTKVMIVTVLFKSVCALVVNQAEISLNAVIR